MKTCPTCLQLIPEPMDMNPCNNCLVGWATYSQDEDGNAVSTHCHDTCEIFKEYYREEKSGK